MPDFAFDAEPPVIGPDQLSPDAVRAVSRPAHVPEDPLGRQIARIISLHPDLLGEFRGIDLNALSEVEKKEMLDIMSERLDLGPRAADSAGGRAKVSSHNR